MVILKCVLSGRGPNKVSPALGTHGPLAHHVNGCLPEAQVRAGQAGRGVLQAGADPQGSPTPAGGWLTIGSWTSCSFMAAFLVADPVYVLSLPSCPFLLPLWPVLIPLHHRTVLALKFHLNPPGLHNYVAVGAFSTSASVIQCRRSVG